MEQEEYTKEEIDWSYIEFVDNQDILDLIEKVCKFPSSYLFILKVCLFSCNLVLKLISIFFLTNVCAPIYLMYFFCSIENSF